MTIQDRSLSATAVVGLIELSTPVDQVLAQLTDATTLPQWAPGFADAVQHRDGSRWLVTKDDRAIDLRIDANGAVGTVDFVRESPSGDTVGVRLRATPRAGGGAVVTMTLPIRPETSAQEAQAIADEELAALARLVESLTA